jgi:hypothetical protein
LEFLTHSYSDQQASPQNQAATDDQARKYKEEYERYEQDLKRQQAEYVFISIFSFINLVFFNLVTKKTIQMQQHQLMNNN